MTNNNRPKTIYCPRCNHPFPYGTPKCPGCGATFGFTEVIAEENAKKHTGEMTTPDYIQVQSLLKKGDSKEAARLVKEIMNVNEKKAKEMCNEFAIKWKLPIPFPKKSFWERITGK